MHLFDAGMVAFAAFHALEGRVDWPLTYQVPRMLRSTLRDDPAPHVLCWNAERTGIGWVAEDDPEEDWRPLREGGRAARERLGL